MVDRSADVFDEQVVAKWLEIAPLADRMMDTVGGPNDFAVPPGSSSVGEDKKGHPNCISRAVQACLVSSVHHMHAAKPRVLDLELSHASAVYSLIRGSLQTLVAPFWLLHPAQCNDRIENTFALTLGAA
jgi:hypothetical protein